MITTIKYYSLDDAKKELDTRRQNKSLVKKIEDDLGNNFLSLFKNKPRSVIWRTIIVPNNSIFFFVLSSEYLNMKPLGLEYTGDMFTSVNEDKKKLCKLKLKFKKEYRNIKICDIQKNENKIMCNVLLNNEENIIHFYKNLLEYSGLNLEIKDLTDWVKDIGSSKDYYYKYLLHFLTHGILFENFFIDSYDDYENKFTEECILPVINKIKEEYGIDPIIVKIYPEANSSDEESFWWLFPKLINEYIINYFKLDN